MGDIAKRMGDKWRNMDSAEKQPYEELARKDRERYDREMGEFRKHGKVLHNQQEDDEEDYSGED